MRFAIFLIALAHLAVAQNRPAWDTTRYQKFENNLIVGFFQSYRNFSNEFRTNPTDTGSSNHLFFAESNLISGIELNYDKFGIAFGIKSTAPDSKKGDTRTFNTNFNIGGNIWFLENGFRFFRGFYDQHTANYDSTFRETGKYYQRPDFLNVLVRSKFLYFTNHRKFSFRSGYACNYRQKRTAATWVLSGNIGYYKFTADSAAFPSHARPYYGNHSDFSGMGAFSFAFNGGGAITIVLWKALFMNLMFIVGPEHQWRTYHYSSRRQALSYMSLSGDVRGSIGLNFRKCYLLWTSQNDFTYYNSSFIYLHNRSLGGSFVFGWRFRQHTPELYRKFQQTKFYQAI